MITLRVKTSPLTKFKSTEVEFHGRTLREVLEPMLVDGEFPSPTVVRVNGIPWLRKDWGGYVEDESTVDVVSVVGADPATIFLIANIVTLVFSLGFTAYGIYKARQAMRALKAGLGQYESDPFFTVDGHGNKANLNNPIEVAYGRNRMWPSYIARPYKNYVDDRVPSGLEGFRKNTTLTQIFCLGQGEFDIHAMKIGEIPIESYSGMRCEIVNPGETIVTSARVAYVQPDTEFDELLIEESSNLFVMTPRGISSKLFEVDIDSSANGTYTLAVSIYPIDDNDAATDSAPITTTLVRPETSDFNSPNHRHTFQFTTPTVGRYSVMFKYTTHTETTSGTITIVELRCFADPTIPIQYSDKTLLVLTYKVSDLIEDVAKDTFNVIATRKLTCVYASGSERSVMVQPTRSIPWAIYDCLTNTVYGGGLSETFLDMESFSELDGELAKDGVFFDYVFNQNTTVEDAAKVIASAGRCFFSYNGSKLALVRDRCNGIPEAMFSCENIIKDSFSWSAEMFDPTEPDSIEASYVTPDSGQEFTTVFTPEGSAGQSVQKLSLQGVGSRTQAWREGAHRMRKLQLIRDTFKFKTGMEGYIPTVGSTAALSWDLTGMGVSGWVEDYDGGWLRLSRAATVATSGAVLGKILLRRDDGSASGPFDVLEGSDGSAGVYKSVRIANVNLDIDFWRTDREPVHFICWSGTGDAPSATKIQINDVSPSDDETIEITASNYDQRVYEFDSVPAPSEADETTPVDPGTGAVGVPWVRVESLATPISPEGIAFTRIRWGRYFGTTSYKVYLNGVNIWSGGETYLDWQIDAGIDHVVAVSAMNGGAEGSGNSVTFDVGQTAILTNPTIDAGNLIVESDGLLIWWDPVLNADGYAVRVEVDGGYSDWRFLEATEFKYTKTMSTSDFGWISVTGSSIAIVFHIKAIVGGVDTATSTLSTSLSKPSAPSAVVVEQDDPITFGFFNENYTRKRTIAWEGDNYCKFRIYMEIYRNGTDSDVPTQKIYTLVAETDKKVFTSDRPVKRIILGGSLVIKNSAESDDFAGDGWNVTIGDAAGFACGMRQGELSADSFWYWVGDESSGKFLPTILRSAAFDTFWVGNLDLVGTISCAIAVPHYILDAGTDWRVKCAIVADNEWLAGSLTAATTLNFDS